jgi:hypothetical protein
VDVVSAKPGEPSAPRLLEALAVLVLVAAQAAAVVVLGLRGVDAFDMSIIPDGGYRIYCGQVPYRDFHAPLGPVVFYLQAGFFTLWGGYTWIAVVAHAAALGGLATALVYLILRLFSRPLTALTFAALTGLTFSLPVSFPWPDHTAFLFVLVALGAFSLAAQRDASLTRRGSLLLTAVAGLAVTGALFSKHSIGGIAAIAVGLLWMFVPFGQEPFRERFLRAVSYAGAVVLCTALVTIWLESRGSFLADLFISTGQSWRFRQLIATKLLAKDFRGDQFLYAADLWFLFVLLALILVSGRRWLYAGGARPARLAVAVAAVGITLFSRRLGAAPAAFFAGLLPLATGLGYGLLGEETPPVRFWQIAGLVTGIALIALRLIARSTGLDFPAVARLVVVGCFLVMLVLPGAASGRQRVRRALRSFLLVTALALGVFYLPLDSERKGWESYPEMQNATVPFTSIPAFRHLRGRSEIVRDYEELADWMRPRLKAEPQRPGQDVCFVPQGQLLYGALDVESFRGGRLWYHQGLSYAGQDPDTALIERTRPRFIVVHRGGQDYVAESGTRLGNEALESMPALRELLAQRYASPVELHGFRVYERRADAEP